MNFKLLVLLGGSPPPTRGKQAVTGYMTPAQRITPAYAGKTIIVVHNLLILEDHPRLRGENRRGDNISCGGYGSPPPTRGKQSILNCNTRNCRITPAYAGKTSTVTFVTLPDRDHPRLRGENVTAELAVLIAVGSPPPTRGKLLC